MPFVSNDGVPVYYEIIGRGEPMVLQHGIFQSTMDWFDAGHVKQLQDNNKLILIDARGHGKSARAGTASILETTSSILRTSSRLFLYL